MAARLSFARWACQNPAGVMAFDALRPPSSRCARPSAMRGCSRATSRPVLRRPIPRLLPSRDTYYRPQGADWTLLVQNARQHAVLWTSRM